MSKYILFLHERTTLDESMSPEEIQSVISEYQAWSQEMGAAGRVLGGQKLTADGGRMLSGFESSLTVTDGPLAEAKEVIGGFFEIEAGTYDEAVDIAQSCPHLKFGGTIELRQIDAMD